MANDIELQNLSKKYASSGGIKKREQWAVKDVSLNVTHGTIFGFLGPNGAGKTTTIKMIMGLTRPTAGTISIMGASHSNHAVRKNIGFLPENPMFPQTLTAYEILRWTGNMMGMRGSILKKNTDTLLKRVFLYEARNKKVASFSKGMIQRLGIAQALIASPRILILDEPLSGLDPPGRQMASEILFDARKEGSTIFFSSHILSDVKTLCDEVGLIVNGHLKSKGSIEEVFRLRENDTDSLDKRFAEVINSDA